MADEDIRMLLQAILDYFQWLKPGENLRGSKRYGQILIEFVIFAIHEDIAWKELFTFDTFREFRKYTMVKNTSHAIISLSGYLHEKGRIDQPLQIPNYQVHLPHIYEQYLLYLEQAKEVSKHHVTSSRRVLASLNQYLENHKIALSALKIEHLDAFLLEFNKPFSMNTQKRYLCRLRDFLNYLYYERKVLRRDLAPLLKGPVQFGQSKPPKFLRSEEIQKLFATLTLNTPTQIRTYAMVHLAYSLGLRPVEISKITLDDISFQKAELIIPKGKTTNPVILPIPDKTIFHLCFAICTYVCCGIVAVLINSCNRCIVFTVSSFCIVTVSSFSLH